ncbi:hypothetical protein [Pseudomonas sp. RIT-PI-AD]|uniref:hypothetical protein n=1 Tax=Pseudomonas sp. RIT-PI-AD TaxID=3035294 RepID=UPI0021D85F8F|nr:hypothetical protein [Pseudomonas sp. RIT-PI-AD]
MSDENDTLTIADYEEVLAGHRRLVRELDVALNGEAGAAPQASLCDIVGQVASAVRLAGKPLLVEIEKLRELNRDLEAQLHDAEERAGSASRNASAFEERMGDLQVQIGKLQGRLNAVHSERSRRLEQMYNMLGVNGQVQAVERIGFLVGQSIMVPKLEAQLTRGAAYVEAEPVDAHHPNVSGLVETLEYYAKGHHLVLFDSSWDTCSGEPANWLHDEAGTASVEDGSVAKAALAAWRAQQGEGGAQ